MRVEQLEYLIAVIQRGSMRKAGDLLHLSQPALSESMRNLERELGVTLLDRRRSGTRISREGRDLLPSIIDVLESVDRLRAAADKDDLPARMVRIGIENTHPSPLAPAVRALRETRPGTAVEIVSTQQAELFTALAEGSLDLGVVAVLSMDDVPAELSATELLSGRAVVACRADHAFAGQAEVTVEALRGESIVIVRPGDLMQRIHHRLFGATLPLMQVSSESAHMGMLLVAEGMGVTVLPSFDLDGHPLAHTGAIVPRPITGDAPHTSLLCVHRAGRPLTPAVRELREQLLRHAHG